MTTLLTIIAVWIVIGFVVACYVAWILWGGE